MCSHYQAIRDRERYRRLFGVDPPPHPYVEDVWPGYGGAFIRRTPLADVGDEAVPLRESLNGLFGLLPHWARDTKLGRATYNARSETVHEKPSFRDAWRRARQCIVPAQAIYEPDWRSGRAVAARIGVTLATPGPQGDAEPVTPPETAMGLAGLWDQWRSPQGEVIHSYTLLTINADAHGFMREYHRPGEEKRMVVVLPPERWDAWLDARGPARLDFLQPWPSERWRQLAP